MIIIEGMDNTGKTTLTRSLGRDLGLEVRISPSHLKGTEEMWEWVDNEFEEDPPYPIIYDRFPIISEAVYGPVLRGAPTIPEGKYDGWAKKHNVLIIYCRPRLGRVLKFGERPQMDGVISHAKELVTKYDSVMLSYRTKGWGVVRYDYDNLESYSKVRAICMQYKQQWKRKRQEVFWDG